MGNRDRKLFPAPWEARQQYRENPFLPFWEKERLLRRMFSKDAEHIARNDAFLPRFSKKRFVKDEQAR